MLGYLAGLLLACTPHGAQRPLTAASRPSQPADAERPDASASAAAPDRTALPPSSDDVEEPDEGELLDDSGEIEDASPGLDAALPSRPHPLEGWSEAQLAKAIETDLPSLGSMSIGSPNAGALINAKQAEKNQYYEPISPGGAWATEETLEYLQLALAKVHAQFPDTPPLALGDISTKHGGPARPHISHQSGRDVDIAYFYNDGARWYARGNAHNLDLPRNWAFVRALITETDVDLLLIDRSIQVLLERYAREQGEDEAWLSNIFHGVPGRARPLILHAPGHATHIHIRFFNPIAQETARRCYTQLIKHNLTSAPQRYLSHKVKKNETLGMLARKYKVSVKRIQAVNGLKGTLIRWKSVLKIPVASGPARPADRTRIPARRLPPPSSGRATARAEEPAQPPPTR